MRRTGLRTRVTAGVAAGAFLLAASMALVSYQLIRESLLDERERAAVRAAYFNASIVHAGLAGSPSDIVAVLRVLDTGSERRAVVRRDRTWYARTADTGFTAAIPATLQRMVERGQPAIQRIRTGGEAAIVVGIPLTASTAFYEIDSLDELDRTFQTLALVLTAVAIITAGAGAGVGWYATRAALRPLTSVTDAAQTIAAGNLDARLNPSTEPDLARLSTSFNQMVEQLGRRLERDRRFAADVSHELRSPLQTLEAATSVLTRRREHLDDRSAAAAGMVVDEVVRFQALVNDLIELARSDQPAERRSVNVLDLARQVCRAHDLPPDLVQLDHGVSPQWLVDRRRLERLLGNLVDNAIRYGGGPTAIRISHKDDRCVVVVDDEGPGVGLDDKEVIFQRFVRGRVANARAATNGAGLGLALVADYAAAHGGAATVEDRPGGGARFRVELPGCLP
jgi:signal transduction histidine kinase